MDPKQRIPSSTDAAAADALAGMTERLRPGHSPSAMTAFDPRIIPPSLPLLDGHDARRRAGNYRASRRVCADGWCHYFDVLTFEMERAVL